MVYDYNSKNVPLIVFMCNPLTNQIAITAVRTVNKRVFLHFEDESVKFIFVITWFMLFWTARV